MSKQLIYVYIQLAILFCFSPRLLAETSDDSKYAVNSVLSEGKWHKISIPSKSGTGIYKLTYDDLKKMGLSNPADVKIYGYGGWMLDEDFSKKTYIDDLPQVSIWMSKEPALFGKGDYILFYARNDIKWEYNRAREEFEQTQHPYSSASYYFVTESTDQPLLMKTQSAQGEGGTVISTFDDYYLHENELENVAKTGRTLYGESFKSKRSQDFSLPLAGVTSDPASIRYNFISRVRTSVGTLKVSLNGVESKVNYTPLIDNNYYYIHGTTINDVIETTGLQETNTLNLTYIDGPVKGTNMYLNYIRVNYKRKLKPYGAVTLFRSAALDDNVNFQISDATQSLMVFDVTDNTNTQVVNPQLSGSVLGFSASNSTIREYAMVDLSKEIPKPEIVSNKEISNQNLHASKGVDMIIIVQPKLKSYAEKLAKLHEEDSGLKSLVVDPQSIYNEFSSGKPDVTAYRRFMKMLYDRALSEGGYKPKYLLLFGGGNYNNRSLGEGDNTQETMLLSYQSPESLVETMSYVTDDYIGFLTDDEGASPERAGLDIGIGRLPVKTERQAENAIKKIENYMRDANKGIWQNNITFVADDLVGSETIATERKHIEDSENLAKLVIDKAPDFVVNKIYEDAYERVLGTGGATYPQARKALFDRINNGTLVLNFVGHGSTRDWTHEGLLTYADVDKMTNDKLPLWITATCDFSRFDSDEVSSGELAFLNPSGGAIALFSTVRVVLINENTRMNRNIVENLFQKDEGDPTRLGDIIRNAKADMVGNSNKLRFLLLGDPALRLAYPEKTYKVKVTEINQQDVSDIEINIQSLDNVVIKGHIADQNDAPATDYNGILESVIFDAIQDLRTVGNQKNGTVDDDIATDYTDYTNILFTGRVEVKNGEFQVEFVAPKDVLYTKGNGKMSFLAYDNDGNNKAQGSFYNYTVGGRNEEIEEEGNPPVIESMFLDQKVLEPGIYVTPTPTFEAKISDDTGINLSSGIGHRIALFVDNKYEYDLTPYFMNDGSSSKSGTVKYQLPELTLGNHYLEFRIWDVFNNSTISEPIDFVVTGDYGTSVYSFDIWGNPAKDQTKFVFTTETPAQNVAIKISVYSLTGQMIWVYEDRGGADSLNRITYTWDLYGNTGRLMPGVYICTGQITIDGKASSIKSQRLMINGN